VKNKSGLHPNWVTGFTDGEGSFIVKIFQEKGSLFG
jgi:hypothetical protein